jgi:CelD/BcsL family acetyltransferase involved in cellulose biosynthesis
MKPGTAGAKRKARRAPTTVITFTSFAELERFRGEWDDFVQSCGSDIYFTLDWLETWWKYYGEGRKLRCFLIHAGGRPIAALPFCIQQLRLGPISLSLARFVGADSTLPVFTPAVEEGYEKKIWRVVLHRLFADEQLDAVSLSPISGLSLVRDEIKEIATQDSNFQIVRDDSVIPHTMFFLPTNIDEYLSTLSTNTRTMNRRYARKLNKTRNVAFRTWRGKKAAERFEDFAKLHGAQWKAKGKLGHFGDWPSSFEFHRELATKLANHDRVRIHEIRGDGELLAAQYSFVLGDRCYWQFPARRPGIAGMGRLAFVMMIKALIEEGINLIEGGRGHYGDKVRFGGKELPLRRLVLAKSASVARIKAKFLLAWADLLNFLYYRVWFLRVAPRIRRRRPLWRTWIMTQLCLSSWLLAGHDFLEICT